MPRHPGAGRRANQAFAVPARRIVANLAPADLRKAGPQYDLPLALAKD
jgi:magnesium chelatase family protein